MSLTARCHECEDRRMMALHHIWWKHLGKGWEVYFTSAGLRECPYCR